jgi:aryl-alcohol dehydrogenase-like predicted oxidoreductase
MQYRRIGHTDLSVSEIGFGCGGNAGLMVRGQLREQIRVIERALALGITYFDNAPDYGDGKAEENLGRVLKQLGARPVINSKVEIRAADLGDIAGHVVRSAEESLRRLGIEQLDVFQAHNGPSGSQPLMEGKAYRQLWIEDFLRPGGACEGIVRLKDAGKIRHAGFICRGDDAEAAITLLDTGLFALINVHYTLLNPTAAVRKPPRLAVPDFGNIIAAAMARGASAAVYSPLAGGFLTDDFMTGAARHPLARRVDAGAGGTQVAAARVATLAFLPDQRESLAQAAFRFVLANPGVATVLGGFSALEQMEEIVAVSGRGPIAPHKMRGLEMLWDSNFERESHPG